MPNCTDLMLTITNYGEVVDGCEFIIETCYLLGMPQDAWIEEYIHKHIEFYVWVR